MENNESISLDEKISLLISKQNLNKGILYSVIGALVGALIWGLITFISGYTFSIIAIVVGVLVGLGMNIGGQGIELKFGIIGGIIALFSIIVGDFFATILLISKEMEISISSVFDFFYMSDIFSIVFESYDLLSLLFCAVAIYVAFKTSIKSVDKD